jgi:hypothetical protein
MATRSWRYYRHPGLPEIQLGQFASSAYDTRLARATCANYAEVRRNVICLAYNFRTYGITMPGPESDHWYHMPSMHIGGRIHRPGRLRIYLCLFTISALDADAIECVVKCGRDSTRAKLVRGAGAVYVWGLITLDLTGDYVTANGDVLDIAIKTIGTNTFTLGGVSVYQEGGYPAVAGNPEYSDLFDVNCLLGRDDHPDDVLAMRLLRDNCCAVRQYKAPKANIWCQWFGDYYTNQIAFGGGGVFGGNETLGVYRFVKRRGVSEVRLHYWAHELTGAGGSTVRAEIRDPDGELAAGLLPAAAQTAVLPMVIGNPPWRTITWTFQGADITEERNLELALDGMVPGPLEVLYLPAICLVETQPSVAIAHTVPDPISVPIHSSILSGEIHRNVRDTLDHLYQIGGRQILVADWRFTDNETLKVDWGPEFICVQNAWARLYGNPAVFANTTVAQAILFSSTSSRLLRSRFEYSTDNTLSATKYTQVALDDTFGGGIVDYYEADPRYDGATNNIHQFLDVVDGRYRRAIERAELEIRAADWEEHFDGINEPPQVFVSARGNTAGYVIPHQYTLEEIELHPNRFP